MASGGCGYGARAVASRLTQGVRGPAGGVVAGPCWRGGLLTDEVGDDPLLPAQKDHFDARVLGAHQVRGDLGRGQTQNSFPVDLAQNVALLDQS